MRALPRSQTRSDRMGPWELTAMEVPKVARQKLLDDITDSVGQVFLAQPLQCARCHDHKLDQIGWGHGNSPRWRFRKWRGKSSSMTSPTASGRFFWRSRCNARAATITNSIRSDGAMGTHRDGGSESGAAKAPR